MRKFLVFMFVACLFGSAALAQTTDKTSIALYLRWKGGDDIHNAVVTGVNAQGAVVDTSKWPAKESDLKGWNGYTVSASLRDPYDVRIIAPAAGDYPAIDCTVPLPVMRSSVNHVGFVITFVSAGASAGKRAMVEVHFAFEKSAP